MSTANATVLTIYDAKATFSQLVKRVAAGETVYVGAYGQPQIMLTAAPKTKKRNFGAWRNSPLIRCEDSAVEGLDEDIQEMFYGPDWRL
jgi:antitoxin (DNA-binding transcriptional repressor) of toxin-antitoxin stability system